MFSSGTGLGLGNIFCTSNAKSRSITAENPKGAKGKGAMAEVSPEEIKHPARELGKGWKVRPSVTLDVGEKFLLAEIEGPGIINHIWMTAFPEAWRHLILRFYWDEEENPSVEVPMGDLFCNGWCSRSNVSSLPISVNPAGGFNIYFPMPFVKKARITVENISFEKQMLFYQVDYVLTDIPDNSAYFHAHFRRENPVKYKEPYTIVHSIKGKGQYVGTYMAWQVNSNDWWGEGEIKFYMDGDKEYPTICGTGTEDYFGGAWNFEFPKGEYGEFSNLYHGLNQVIKPDGLYKANERFSMYRFHILDPIYFERDLRVTIQALGWRSHGRFLPLQDDIASVAYWYQVEPHEKFPKLPDYNDLEVI